MKSFTLPDLGEGLAESEIIEWHVKVGDVVEVDQVVLTVETAKATVEVPAPYSGTIVSRHGNEGDVISIGSLLMEIDETNSADPGNQEKQEAKSKQRADAATVVGSVSHQSHSVNVDEFWVGSQVKPSGEHISALPSARALAQKLGVNLQKITGSGPDGIIIEADVYHACDQQLPGTEVLKGARRTMVGSMTESHQQIAAVTITEEALLDKWPKGEDITARLIQAVVSACEQEPAMNAWFDAETMTRCVHHKVNIGIAVDSSHGLYVPVLKDAGSLNPKAIRQWINETAESVRSRKVGREEFQHATITLSNFGAIAGIYATPVVTPPQVAIVGAGRLIEKLILVNNKPVSVRAMPLSVTFDHRACTGGEAARFVKAIVEHLSKPHG
ncbi:2-oxo acid dehydrogenase subunit E2 [Photobacterium sp. CCB-ST2H9]|uniref:dihydrolipoamide acetyltransferase family protein n=1 Tax=unclassified Photobacterium TaxID=2628852 RepID=UPI002003A110|nr:dihydrolipoamide acetyltransferase family protein [Photobacterium sp. CCB-ST2H9]UTM60076.1 2-oxo acid dehydrogenase subunit E2 [Photobacterium sp. CCB-ST2H9]